MILHCKEKYGSKLFDLTTEQAVGIACSTNPVEDLTP